MQYTFPPDVDQLVRSSMATGNYRSEDEVLREALLLLAEQEEDLVAIRESLSALAAGDTGLGLEDAFREVRRRYEADSGT